MILIDLQVVSSVSEVQNVRKMTCKIRFRTAKEAIWESWLGTAGEEGQNSKSGDYRMD